MTAELRGAKELSPELLAKPVTVGMLRDVIDTATAMLVAGVKQALADRDTAIAALEARCAALEAMIGPKMEGFGE